MAECPHGDSDLLSEAELEGQEHVGYSASSPSIRHWASYSVPYLLFTSARSRSMIL